MSEENARKTLDALDTRDLFREFMRRFGVDVTDEHFQGTPDRVIRMYQEVLCGYDEPKWEFTTFDAGDRPSLITVTHIDYYSLCSHHLCPFSGIAHIAYLPNKVIAGLSKFARAVKHFSARLQVQERLTCDIADFLEEKLNPRALAVMMTGEHLCMSMRGVKCPGHQTTTSQMRGAFIEDYGLKQEFFTIININGQQRR
jgi:GTP cyclohydrolase IA